MREVNINQDNVLRLVSRQANRLPDRYVTALRFHKFSGKTIHEEGAATTRLWLFVFDSSLPDWKHAPAKAEFRFDDSEGTRQWALTYNALRAFVRKKTAEAAEGGCDE